MASELERYDTITIRDLLLRCIVGINPEERVKRQDVVINLTLHTDLRKAGASDSIDDTVNYKLIKDEVVALVEGSSYFLVERMAEMIARTCLAFTGVCAVSVRVEKPGALRFAKNVGVEIHRTNE